MTFLVLLFLRGFSSSKKNGEKTRLQQIRSKRNTAKYTLRYS